MDHAARQQTRLDPIFMDPKSFKFLQAGEVHEKIMQLQQRIRDKGFDESSR
jgi:hypothetical protein